MISTIEASAGTRWYRSYRLNSFNRAQGNFPLESSLGERKQWHRKCWCTFWRNPFRIVLRYFSAHKPTLLHNFSRNSFVFYRFPAVDGATCIEMERQRQKREWHFSNLWWECFNLRDIMQLFLLIAARASTKVMQLVSTLASDLNSWRHCNSSRRLAFRMIWFLSDKSFTKPYGRNFYNIKIHWNQIKQLFFFVSIQFRCLRKTNLHASCKQSVEKLCFVFQLFRGARASLLINIRNSRSRKWFRATFVENEDELMEIYSNILVLLCWVKTLEKFAKGKSTKASRFRLEKVKVQCFKKLLEYFFHGFWEFSYRKTAFWI